VTGSQPRTTPLDIAKKALALCAAAGALFLLAKYAIGSPAHGAAVILLALVPLGLYLALTRPLLFPYSVFLLAVPYDPLLSFSSGAGATLTRLLIFSAEAAFAARMLLVRRAYAPRRSWYAWGAALVAMIASTIWSIDTVQTVNLCIIMLQQFALFTLLGLYPVTRADLKFLSRSIVVCGTLAAFYGLYAYASGTQRLAATRLSIGNQNVHLDPNHYAACFFIPVAVAVALLFRERRLVRIAVPAGALVVLVANSLLTGSRGGLVGIGIIIIYTGIRMRRYLLTGLVTASALALSFAIPNVWQRVLDPSQGEGSGRFELWVVGIAALKHYWLLGSGFGTFEFAYDQYFFNAYQRIFQGWSRPAHDLLLQSWVELGIVGFAAVVYAWFASFRQNKEIPRGDPLFPMRCAAESMILALFVEALTLDILWYKYLWVALSFALVVANAYRPLPFVAVRFRRRAPGIYRARAGEGLAEAAPRVAARAAAINWSAPDRFKSTLDAPEM